VPARTPADSSRRETGDELLTSAVARNESHILTCAVLTIHAGNCILRGQIDACCASHWATAAAPRRRCERQVGHIMLWGVGRCEAYQILRDQDTSNLVDANSQLNLFVCRTCCFLWSSDSVSDVSTGSCCSVLRAARAGPLRSYFAFTQNGSSHHLRVLGKFQSQNARNTK
jgi:hypothetical protein